MDEVARPEAYDWRAVEIPGGTIAVSLVRLAIDRQSLVSQSLVQFPPGWARPNPGWYSADEEFLILEGVLNMSGATYRAGDYAYIPASYVRSASTTPEGSLILAWFSGKALWSEATDHGPGYSADRLVQATWADLPDQTGPAGVGRRLRAEDDRSTWVLTGALPAVAPAALDLFSIRDHTWAQTQPGDPIPDLSPPVFARFHATASRD